MFYYHSSILCTFFVCSLIDCVDDDLVAFVAALMERGGDEGWKGLMVILVFFLKNLILCCIYFIVKMVIKLIELSHFFIQYLFSYVVCDLAVLVYLINRNKCQDVLRSRNLILQPPIIPHPAQQHRNQAQYTKANKHPQISILYPHNIRLFCLWN